MIGGRYPKGNPLGGGSAFINQRKPYGANADKPCNRTLPIHPKTLPNAQTKGLPPPTLSDHDEWNWLPSQTMKRYTECQGWWNSKGTLPLAKCPSGPRTANTILYLVHSGTVVSAKRISRIISCVFEFPICICFVFVYFLHCICVVLFFVFCSVPKLYLCLKLFCFFEFLNCICCSMFWIPKLYCCLLVFVLFEFLNYILNNSNTKTII